MIHIGPNLMDLVRWDCPPMDWYKISFHGASKGNLGIAGCGIIIRNENGDRMGSMAIPIGIQTYHVAKESATLYGLIYAKSLNLNNIWLEGDSLTNINCLNRVTKSSWTINNTICQAIDLINSFENFIITHNFREKNQVVD